SLQLMHRGGIGVLGQIAASEQAAKPPEHELKALEQVEWASVLREGNRWYDRLTSALRVKDRAGREGAIDKIEDDIKALKIDFTRPAILAKLDMLRRVLINKADAEKVGKAIGDILIGLMEPGIRKVQDATDRYDQRQRNLLVAFALAAYR